MNIARLAITTAIAILPTCLWAGETLTSGKWTLGLDKGVSISYGGKTVASHATAEFDLGGKTLSTRDYPKHKATQGKATDKLGKASVWTVTYQGKGLPRLVQTFRIYDKFLTVSATVYAPRQISTNCIAPLVSNDTGDAFRSADNRQLFVPFDNDCWIRFRSDSAAHNDLRSYEATAIYNAKSRAGIVMGAIDHDTWKNAIDIKEKGKSLKLTSGVADELTRDRNPHGTVSGRSVGSARFLIGVFDDWRQGLDTFADANATITPPRKWDKAVPFGWNSWGTLQFKVNHKNATEVSAFFANKLQNHSFANADSLVYIGIDSGWNSIADNDLKDFADQCRQRHQVPCVYWTPFADWSKNGEKQVPGTSYKYKDVWLYANGKPQELDGAYAVDPTHPAIRKTMEDIADKFRALGFKYVKMDFMTHGRMEADHWYNKGITTGTQAYNYGMRLLDSLFHDMYLNLSISPIFPAQYAQSRRIACDAWNKMKDTEYTMNALSYGWWVGRVYDFNDADHVVLRDASDGENRARITSSAITGLYIIGDDFSEPGDRIAKNRAMSYLTNPAINRMATGVAFRPLEGDDDKCENCFIRHEANGDIYLVCFNYGDDNKTFTINPERLGIASFDLFEATELWSGRRADLSRGLPVATKDVNVYLLKKL